MLIHAESNKVCTEHIIHIYIHLTNIDYTLILE